MSRLLVLGHNGFVGTHVLESARAHTDIEIVVPQPDFDVRNTRSVAETINDARPDWILHLAAQSSVADSLKQPIETYSINTIGTANVVSAAVDRRFTGRMLFVSSADVYGTVDPSALPIGESQPAAPRNPYAASKLAAEFVCLEAVRRSGLDVVIARPFNHIGPGQDTRFVVASFAAQIAAIAAGDRLSSLTVGDLSIERDFSDVRDVVSAYLTLLQRGERGVVYNVCSGVARRLDYVLQQLMNAAKTQVRIEVDHARFRVSETPCLVGDNRRLQSLGWKPQIALPQTLNDVFESAFNAHTHANQ